MTGDVPRPKLPQEPTFGRLLAWIMEHGIGGRQLAEPSIKKWTQMALTEHLNKSLAPRQLYRWLHDEVVISDDYLEWILKKLLGNRQNWPALWDELMAARDHTRGLRKTARETSSYSERVAVVESQLSELFNDTNEIRLSSLATRCQLFPFRLPDVGEEFDGGFEEGTPETNHRIWLDFDPGVCVSDNDVLRCIREISDLDENQLSSRDRVRRNRIANVGIVGSNRYCRLTGYTKLDRTEETGARSVEFYIRAADAPYILGLLREFDFQTPTLLSLKAKHQLNLLAVRVFVVIERPQHGRVAVFHRRSGRNSTFKHAWDVGAAGYIDVVAHQDTETGAVSLCSAAADEIKRELKIEKALLPNWEHYRFFGITRNMETGQLDVVGQCVIRNADVSHRVIYDPLSYVSEIDTVALEPETIARFIAEKRHWVPSALLTSVLALLEQGREKKSWKPGQVYDAFSKYASDIELRSEPS